MVALDSMTSLAIIESPEGTTCKRTMIAAIREKFVGGSTYLMCSARWNENVRYVKRAIL